MPRAERHFGLRAALVVLLAAANLSCGGDSGTEVVAPATIQMLGGNRQEATVGTDLANPLLVEVLDARGRPVGGQSVAWTVEAGGGSVTPEASVTNADGEARTFLRVGPVSGAQLVHATLGDLEPVVFEATARARAASGIASVSGSAQTANVDAQLPQAIVVRVFDSEGEPVPGVIVDFAASHGGTVDPSTVSTGGDGRAAATWTLGGTAGTQTATATAAGVPGSATFTATARSVVGLTLAVVSGDEQSAQVSSVLSAPLVVRLTETGGAPAAGATVQFTTTAGGTLTPASATTDANGEASVTWRLGTVAGRQSVTVATTGATSVVMRATATPGPATQLAIVSGNDQVGGIGQPLPNPVVVRLSDAWDNAVEGATVGFSVTSGGGSISPTSGTTGADGRASATWTLGPAQGANAAMATVAGIGNAVLSATGAPVIHTLAHRVVDAEFNAATNRIVTVSANPSRLHIIDPDTRATQTVDLPQVPNAVAVQPDGAFAAVGHDGWISYVDLSTRTVQRVYPVTTDVVDIVLSGNGWVYAFPRTDQWETIRSIELATGAETLTGTIRAGTLVRLHPSGSWIYGANNGLSPSDFEKYDIRTGVAKVMYDSPYHGDYSFGGNVWISEDGLRLFARSGNVFRSSDVRTEDMLYGGKLSGMSLVQWATQSTAAGRIFAFPGPSWDAPAASELRIYDNAFLAQRGIVPLPQFAVPGVGSFMAEGRFVFVSSDGEYVYALLRAEGAAGLAQDWGLVVYSTDELP